MPPIVPIQPVKEPEAKSIALCTHPITVALSPCPNDTFLFYPWIEGFVGQHLPIEPHFADIQQLNVWSTTQPFHLIKCSFAQYPKIKDHYSLLPVGAALGFNCGPKLIAKTPFSIEDLIHKTVAIPGYDTTAHLLLHKLLPAPKKKVFCLYSEIQEYIENNRVDCGLIIHESRFTFKRRGWHEILDLGELWHKKKGLPLPLGGLCISKKIDDTTKKTVVDILKQSLQWSYNHREEALAFALQTSQELDRETILNHIATYITAETAELSPLGYRAIEALLT